ncbi:plasmid recombination protein [Bacillus cereus]
MSFAICRMQKFKAKDVKGIQFHNQREKESHTNPDIEKEYSHLNYDLHNKQHIDYLENVKEKIEQNVETNRAVRKDAVMMCEFIVTSDKVFFDGIDPHKERQFFEDAYNFLKNRYGEDNITHATVHLDEKTPHMHVGMVPVTEDKKLSAKQIFNRKELVSLQDDFHAYMVKQGFVLERGVSSDRKHIETTRMKALTAKEEVQELEHTLVQKEQEKQQLDQSMSEMKKRLVELKKSLNGAKQVDKIEVKEKGGFIRSKTVEIASEDFQTMKSLAKVSEAFRDDNRRLKNEIASLKQEKDNLYKCQQILETKVVDLNRENQELKTETDFLKKTLERVKELCREKLPELAGVIGYVKANVLDKMNHKFLKRYFTNEDEIQGAQKFLHHKQEQKEKERQDKQMQINQKRNRNMDLER